MQGDEPWPHYVPVSELCLGSQGERAGKDALELVNYVHSDPLREININWLFGRIFEGMAFDRILKAFSPESVFCTLSAALARGFVVLCFIKLLLNGFIVKQYWQFCKRKHSGRLEEKRTYLAHCWIRGMPQHSVQESSFRYTELDCRCSQPSRLCHLPNTLARVCCPLHGLQ